MPLSEEARAVEAVLIVAVEPVPPGLLAELLEIPVDRVEPLCDELIESCRTDNRGSPCPHRRREPDPDPSRPRPLRGAVRQRRRVVPTLGCRPRDLGHRGLQATRLPRPDRRPPGRERRRGRAPVGASWVHRRHRSGPRAGAARSLRHDRGVLGADGLDRVEQLPPVEDLLPGPEAVAEVRGAAPTGWGCLNRSPPTTEGERFQKVLARFGLGPAGGEDLMSRGRVTVNGESPSSAGGWTSSVDRVALDGVPCPSSPGSSTTW